MSKQEVLLHWISYYKDLAEDKIIEYMQYKDIVTASDIKQCIEIYQYKTHVDENHDIPKPWISELMAMVRKGCIDMNHISKVLEYLNGADLVQLEIALARCGNTLIEDFAAKYIRRNPVLGVVLDTNNWHNFPCYQTTKNYKFLYHLLYSYPNLSIIGGPYGVKQGALTEKTCISLYNHREYLIEKALKGGGLAFALNVFNRILINAPFRFPPKPKPRAHVQARDFQTDDQWIKAMMDSIDNQLKNTRHYGTNSIVAQLNDLYIIPEINDSLFHFMSYFCLSYLRSDHMEQFEEIFEEEYGIDADDDEYETRFRRWLESEKYTAMSAFIETVRPQLPQIAWDKLLTQQLGMVASGKYECAAILMDLGAKINLSGKISNNKTCDVIEEALCCSNTSDGIRTLIEIFKRAKESDFEDEAEKISERQLNAILNHTTNYQLLGQLIATLMSKVFVLDEDAQVRLKRVRLS